VRILLVVHLAASSGTIRPSKTQVPQSSHGALKQDTRCGKDVLLHHGGCFIFLARSLMLKSLFFVSKKKSSDLQLWKPAWCVVEIENVVDTNIWQK
jgi:hypothetical protein